MCAEASFAIGAEHLLAEVFERAFQVAERDVLVYHQAFALRELGKVRREGILRDTESFELVEERLKTGDCVRPSTSLSDSGIRPEAKEDTIFRNRCVEIPVCDKGADGRFDAIDFRVEGIRNCSAAATSAESLMRTP